MSRTVRVATTKTRAPAPRAPTNSTSTLRTSGGRTLSGKTPAQKSAARAAGRTRTVSQEELVGRSVSAAEARVQQQQAEQQQAQQQQVQQQQVQQRQQAPQQQPRASNVTPAEPPEEKAVRVLLTLSSGKKMEGVFAPSATVDDIIHWAAPTVQPRSVALLLTYPRQELAQGTGETLEGLGFKGKIAMVLERRGRR